MPLLYKTVTGSAGAALGLLFLSESDSAINPTRISFHPVQIIVLTKLNQIPHLVLGIWAFAAIGSLTAASRCTWAFSRDGGIPGSQWWKKVNPRFGVPLNGLILSTVVCALLGLIYLGSSAAFNAFTGGTSSASSDRLKGRRRVADPRHSRHHLPRLLVRLSRALLVGPG
jgi:amino acid transporter